MWSARAANQVFARPAGLSAIDAAAIPINYLTAWQLLVVMGGLKKGETVLIHSVGGGVGIAATQIAKHIGARVIGTASAAKHGELAALGVDHLIDYRTEDFETRARAITDGRGVHLILDPVGGRFAEEGLPPAGADGPTRRLRRFVPGAGEDAKPRRRAVDAREHAVAPVQSSRLDEREQGRLRRQSEAPLGRP